MRDSSRHLFSHITCAGLAITTLLLLFPIVSLNAQGLSAESSAQTGDLRATIETSLRSDPSSVSLSQEEFEQLVDALVEVAEKQGVSAAIQRESPKVTPSGFTACHHLPRFNLPP